MKKLHLFLISLAMFGIGTAYADSMDGMNMKGMDMKSMPEKQNTQVHHAVGVVKSIDAGSITIAHQAVPTAKWPAMTMGFKATKEMMASVKPEQPVDFEFTISGGMEATLTKITAKN